MLRFHLLQGKFRRHLPRLAGCFLVLVVALGGCATAPSVPPDEPERAISPQDRELLRSATTIRLLHTPGPPFEFKLNATGMLLVVGGVYSLPTILTADQRNAQEVQRECRLEDPIPNLKQRFLDHLSTDMRPLDAISVDTPINETTPQDLGKVVQGGFAFVFRTTVWQVWRDSDAGFKHYRTTVGAMGRLVQVEEGRTVWEANCRATSREATDIVELRTENGRLLKLKLKEAAESCADKLWAQLLGQGMPSNTR